MIDPFARLAGSLLRSGIAAGAFFAAAATAATPAATAPATAARFARFVGGTGCSLGSAMGFIAPCQCPLIDDVDVVMVVMSIMIVNITVFRSTVLGSVLRRLGVAGSSVLAGVVATTPFTQALSATTAPTAAPAAASASALACGTLFAGRCFDPLTETGGTVMRRRLEADMVVAAFAAATILAAVLATVLIVSVAAPAVAGASRLTVVIPPFSPTFGGRFCSR